MNVVDKPEWGESFPLRLLSDLVNSVKRSINVLLLDTRPVVVTSTSATYQWDAYQYGQVWLTQTSGAALEIQASTASAALSKWQEGRMITFVVENSTGAPLTITLSSDFSGNGTVLADGSIACWNFRVRPSTFAATITATMVEV